MDAQLFPINAAMFRSSIAFEAGRGLAKGNVLHDRAMELLCTRGLKGSQRRDTMIPATFAVAGRTSLRVLPTERVASSDAFPADRGRRRTARTISSQPSRRNGGLALVALPVIAIVVVPYFAAFFRLTVLVVAPCRLPALSERQRIPEYRLS